MAKNMIRRPFPRGGIRTRLPVTIYRRSSDEFSPTEISGLALWLDASDGSTLFQNSDGTVPATATSDPVGYWGDKSGNGRHAVQATAGSRPLVGSIASGRGLVFDSNDSLLSLASMADIIGAPASSPATTIAFIALNSSGAAGFTMGANDAANGRLLVSNSFDAAGASFFDVAGTSGGRLSYTLPASSQTTASVYIMQRNGASMIVRRNGATIATKADASQTYSATTARLALGQAVGLSGFAGTCASVLCYPSALTATQYQRLEQYLATRWGITLAPQVSNADAQNWIDRVYANGGTVSSATAAAVNQFCVDLENAPGGSIRDRFFRLNLFCGSFQGAFVPLFRGPSLGGTQYGGATDTNLGSPAFLVGDYNETGVSGGLLGNGTTKYLNTAFNVDQLPGAANCHLSSFITGTQDIASPRALIGTLFNGVADRYRIFLNNTTAGNYLLFTELGVSSQASATRANANGGLMLASRTGTTLLTLYDDAVSVGTNETSTAEVTGASPFFVFARNGPTEFYNGRMAAYSIGAGMTAAQVTAYNTAMQAFQTAMTRIA